MKLAGVYLGEEVLLPSISFFHQQKMDIQIDNDIHHKVLIAKLHNCIYVGRVNKKIVNED